MKKLSILLLTTILSGTTILAQDNRSFKRGFGEETLVYEEDYEQLKKGSVWFYDWGAAPAKQIADLCGVENGLEFVPMIWGASYNLNTVKAWSEAHPNDRYVLGFNEPNLTGDHGGSAITPTVAAEKWHEIEQFAKDNNLILIAPALNYSPDIVDGVHYSTPDMWMDAWINAYKDAYGTEPQYDYLALHSYMGSVDAMKPYIDNFAKKYGKQVWLTEFASAPDGITEDEASQIRKMIAMVNMVEKNENVFRYAWFKGRDGNSKPPYWGLITKPNQSKGIGRGHLSALGYAYNNMPHDNLDKYYEVGENIPANQFVDCKDLANIRQSQDALISNGPELDLTGGGASATYQVNVATAGDYKLVLRLANDGKTPRVNILDNDGNTLVEKFEIPSTGGEDKYQDVAIDVTLKAGKQAITVQKDNFAAFYLSVVCLSTDGKTGIQTATTQKAADNNWYTLQGTKVNNPTQKGVYIHNGRKVVLK